MYDYTIMIQSKIKQEEAQKDKNRRLLVDQVEAARRQEHRTNTGKSQQTHNADQDSHN